MVILYRAHFCQNTKKWSRFLVGRIMQDDHTIIINPHSYLALELTHLWPDIAIYLGMYVFILTARVSEHVLSDRPCDIWGCRKTPFHSKVLGFRPCLPPRPSLPYSSSPRDWFMKNRISGFLMVKYQFLRAKHPGFIQKSGFKPVFWIVG